MAEAADGGSTKEETVSKAEYEKTLERARRFEAMATDFEKRYKGFDPEEYKAVKEENLLLKKQGAVGDQKKIDELIEAQKQELEKRYSSKYEELEGVTKTQGKELKELRVVSKAMTKAAEVFNTDALPLIRREIESSCDWQDGDIVVLGEDQKPRASKVDPRKNMTIDEYIGELSEKFASCAKPKGKPGVKQNGTADTARGQSSDVTVEKYLKMSPEERRQLPNKDRVRLSQEALRQMNR